MSKGGWNWVGQPTIRVVGVGGAGCRIIRRLMPSSPSGVQVVAVDMDWVSVRLTDAPHRVELDAGTLHGLGSGGKVDWARRGAEACVEQLAAVLVADVVVIVAGMGGGTAGGAAPVVARIARSLGKLTVGVATTPLALERERRAGVAREGLAALTREVDSLIVLPCDGVLATVDARTTSLPQLYEAVDAAVCDVVLALAELMLTPGKLYLDPAELRAIFACRDTVHVGIGRAMGGNAARSAARLALDSPLLQASVSEASHVLAHLQVGKEMKMEEIVDAGALLRAAIRVDTLLTVQAHVHATEQEGACVVLFAAGRPASLP